MSKYAIFLQRGKMFEATKLDRIGQCCNDISRKWALQQLLYHICSLHNVRERETLRQGANNVRVLFIKFAKYKLKLEQSVLKCIAMWIVQSFTVFYCAVQPSHIQTWANRYLIQLAWRDRLTDFELLGIFHWLHFAGQAKSNASIIFE